jgi:hypothetical protein
MRGGTPFACSPGSSSGSDAKALGTVVGCRSRLRMASARTLEGFSLQRRRKARWSVNSSRWQERLPANSEIRSREASAKLTELIAGHFAENILGVVVAGCNDVVVSLPFQHADA